MGYSTPAVRACQQAIPNSCPAKLLPPSQRLTLGVQGLTGQQTVTRLAEDFDVSRKFVYQQVAIAEAGLAAPFTPAEEADDKVLFHLPVTKALLRQIVLGLCLICHSSIRGI